MRTGMMKQCVMIVIGIFSICCMVHDAEASATLQIYADPAAANPEYRTVVAGDKVSFSAYGTWSPTSNITCGPQGTGETATSGFVYPGAPKYSLILVFYGITTKMYSIGTGTTITFDSAGSFYLRINDIYLPAEKPTGYITVNLQSGNAIDSEAISDPVGWQNPVTTQSYRTFQSTVFSEKVEPAAARQEKEKTKGGVMKPNEASSAVEYEFFKLSGNEGNNLTVNVGLARTNDDQTRSYGFNAYLNTLSFKGGDSFNNSNISLFGKQTLKQTDTSSLSVGMNFDYLMLDGGYSNDDGLGVGAMVSGTRALGTSMLSWGGMYQYAKLGKYIEHIANVGLMGGKPIGDLFAVSLDLFGTYKMNATFDGGKVDIDEPLMLNLGLYGDYYVSRAFGVNAGVKKVLFVNDYQSTEIVIGAKARF